MACGFESNGGIGLSVVAHGACIDQRFVVAGGLFSQVFPSFDAVEGTHYEIKL